MHIQQLYQLAGREEIDYSFIMAALTNYARPRDKISAWLKDASLIRVKKGLYVFGPHVAQKPYSLVLLANLIYGPSAISLQYALSFHGLIPEGVSTITSITNKRNKRFNTPVGTFSYRYLNHHRYALGIDSISNAAGYSTLIASPEKALCDVIYLEDKHLIIENRQDIETYLFHDLRLDEESMVQLDKNKLRLLSIQYHHEALTQIVQFISGRIAS